VDDPVVGPDSLLVEVAAYARKDHVQNVTYAELVAVPERAYAIVPDGVDLTTAGALPLAGLTAEQLAGLRGAGSSAPPWRATTTT